MIAHYTKRRALVLRGLAPIVFLLLALAAPRPAAAAAPMPPVRPDETNEQPPVTYVVQPGDNLSSIARHFDTQVQALQEANRMGDTTLILVGRTLDIPIFPLAPQLVSPPNPRRGLAMAVPELDDLTSLGVAWYYTWQWCTDPGCIPMLYRMEQPAFCAPTILVGNEPNAIAPNGWPVTPAAAAARVWAIEQACPQAQLVVGNVAADDWSTVGGTGTGRDWLVAFLADYQQIARRNFQQALGVHCYSQAQAGYCLDRLAELRKVYSGPMWVTEFGILSGSPQEFDTLLQFIAAHFDRFAAYTNRQPHTGQGWELSTGVEMVRGNGSLTPVGDAYALWPRLASSQMR